VLLERRLQALAPARDDQVDDAVLGRELAQLVALAAGDDRDGPLRDTGLGDGGRRDLRQHRVRVGGRRGPAQNDRVARLEAQRRAVDGHVRPRLVDDRDDAERHPHAPDVETVRESPTLDRRANGVRQRGDRADVACDVRQPLVGQLQPVEQPGVQAGLLARLHVASVRLEDLAAARLERGRHGVERGVLRPRVEPGQRARGAPRGGADLGDRLGGGGHHGKGTGRDERG
jgi:hypothetical protein